ncbi:hypothetical protein [Holophaga foetida]|uniref:hypothetical protein n=1 Tax=Holophaga foetida TaxID=35839 RepID=UPI0002471C49|nr:hypothetical protein [Holophaga foetida]
MTLARKTLTSEEAAAYTASLERRARTLGVELEHWVLGPGKQNDIRLGKGPRHAIVAFAQEAAERGATYGQVLGMTVYQGDGSRYKIRTPDLAGFVCANGYCTIAPPAQGGSLPKGSTAVQSTSGPGQEPKPCPPLPKDRIAIEIHTADIPLAQVAKVACAPCVSVRDMLSHAYRCPNFDGICTTMRWEPAQGHIPRGFLGATGSPSEVELVLVFAEPGDPSPGDHATMDEAIQHAYWAFREGQGLFHRNARKLFQLCWPDLSFDEQLRKVWMTESVLCSAMVTTGPVPKAVEQECGSRFLRRQLALFPNAMVVALGSKAQHRLDRIGVSHHKAHAIAPPGCNQQAAYPSWVKVAEALRARRGEAEHLHAMGG